MSGRGRMASALAVCMSLILGGGSPSAAQTVVESTEGTSTLLFGQSAGSFSVNFSQASTKAWLLFGSTASPWRFGVEGKLIASDGFVSLVEDGFRAPNGSLSVTIGLKGESGAVQVSDTALKMDSTQLPDSICGCRFDVDTTVVVDTRTEYKHSHWAWLRLGVQRGEYNLVDIADVSSAVKSDTSHVGLGVSGFYNAYLELRNRGFPGQIYLGTSISLADRDNYSSLSKVELCDEVAANAAGSPGSVTTCSTARSGAYEEAWLWSGGADALWYWGLLENRLIPGFLMRYDEVRATDRWSPGLGLFLTKQGGPLDILGGAVVQRLKGRWRVGLQAGWIG